MNKINEAIYYFEEQGFLEELTSDKKFYVKELITEVKELLLKTTELSIEVDNLAYENKQLAKHLIQNGYKRNEVDSIAKGFDDWRNDENKEEI